MDFRNEDLRILGFRGFIYKPPKPPKIFHADHADHADYADLVFETRILGRIF